MAFDLSRAGFGIKSATRAETIVKIPLAHIEKNEKSFYGLRGIDKLADSIRISGLIHPIAVVQSGPQLYRIISGHSRYAAYTMLAAEEPEKFGEIPARVMESMGDVEEELAVIFANSTQRELTYDEKLKQEKLLRESLEAMKTAGKEVPKNLGVYMAEQLGTSRNEVSRMHSVNQNLIPEAREQVAAGAMNASTAYQLSRKSPEEQEQIVRKPVDTLAATATISEKSEAVQKSYAEQYQEDMQLLAKTLEINLEYIMGDCLENIQNRQEGIEALRKSWSGTYGSNVHGFSLDGAKNGLQITRLGYAETAEIRWADLYDHMAMEALKRVRAGTIAESAPAPKPEIVHEVVLDAGWQTGTPTVKGEYVCEFANGEKRTRHICKWRAGGFFLGSVKITLDCERWIKLPK